MKTFVFSSFDQVYGRRRTYFQPSYVLCNASHQDVYIDSEPYRTQPIDTDGICDAIPINFSQAERII
jgi:hypothetical protein